MHQSRTPCQAQCVLSMMGSFMLPQMGVVVHEVCGAVYVWYRTHGCNAKSLCLMMVAVLFMLNGKNGGNRGEGRQIGPNLPANKCNKLVLRLPLCFITPCTLHSLQHPTLNSTRCEWAQCVSSQCMQPIGGQLVLYLVAVGNPLLTERSNSNSNRQYNKQTGHKSEIVKNVSYQVLPTN